MSSEPENSDLAKLVSPVDRVVFLRNLSLIFLGTVVVTFVFAGAVIQQVDFAWQIAILLACGLIQGAVLIMFGYNSKNPQWWVAIPLAIMPVLNWLAYVMIAGYEPPQPDSPKPRQLPAWLVLGLSPCLCGLVLYAYRPNYMLQLFTGPPIGENIPAIGIPCGWPILFIIGVFVLVQNYALWAGLQQTRLVGVWALAFVGLAITFLTFPSIWLVLMGPAAVQVYKQFYGGY
jgi:hypothetical protein